MKKLVAIILLLFAIGAYNCYAQKGQEIPLTLQYDERGNPTNPVKRAPRFRISAHLEGHTISFTIQHSGCFVINGSNSAAPY